MRDCTRFARSNRALQIIFFAALVAGLVALPIQAQKKPPRANLPKYDLHAEIKIKGTIEEVKLPPKGSEKEIAHLQVNDGTNSLDVYLCPKTFLDDMGMSFAKGDAIAMTGSKSKLGDADVFLVREIVKGNDTFVLRDGKGDPVWD
jgi:uncharacterized membrane protein YagU involved in acid resistance